jgi:hypothetical protein
LLDFQVQVKLDKHPLVVHFTPKYEDGRWIRRNAITTRPPFITEKPMKHEVAVWWTDNRRRRLYRNVSVQYFDLGHPKIEHRAMVITGEGVGLIGNVTSKSGGPTYISLSLLKTLTLFFTFTRKTYVL